MANQCEKFGLYWCQENKCLYERTITKTEGDSGKAVVNVNQGYYTGEAVEVLMLSVPLFLATAVPVFFYTVEEAIKYANAVKKPYENALINRYYFDTGNNMGLSPNAVQITYQC